MFPLYIDGQTANQIKVKRNNYLWESLLNPEEKGACSVKFDGTLVAGFIIKKNFVLKETCWGGYNQRVSNGDLRPTMPRSNHLFNDASRFQIDVPIAIVGLTH